MFVSAIAASRLLAPPITSYANAGGTGDRTGSIATSAGSWTVVDGTINNLVDGAFGNTSSDGVQFNPFSTGQPVNFDFGVSAKKYIDEIKFYFSQTGALFLKIQASNDASSWVDLTSSFQIDSATKTVTLSGMDLAGHRYYGIKYVSGSGTADPSHGRLEEVEFKIADGVS